MNVRGVDFVVYHVPDMRRAKDFYRKTLGLARGGEYTGTWAEFATEPATLCLRATHLTPAQAARNPGQIRWAHAPAVALAVGDVYAAVEELRTKDVPIIAEPWETGVCHKAYIADPFGNPICLHQRKDGTFG
jgi:catechol 2,3-dioxygenase-like lactoylglutathione lyase family enzyme